jgi:hypothetical protein
MSFCDSSPSLFCGIDEIVLCSIKYVQPSSFVQKVMTEENQEWWKKEMVKNFFSLLLL